MPKLPTVSTSGWVDDIAEKADRLLAYYFVSDFSQSNLHRGLVVSLPQQIQELGHDPDALQRGMQSSLEGYIGQYFESAQVSVDATIPNPADPSRIQVTVGIIVTENGVRHSVGKLIQATNGKIADIININNNIGG